MNKEYLITIAGSQTAEGMTETVSLTTFGEFKRTDGKDYISYIETTASGFEGDITTLTITGSNLAILERTGNAKSRLIMEKGRRNICHYDTGFGNLMVGIKTDIIDNHLHDDGGSVTLRYSLDVNSTAISTNQLDITVNSAPENY